MEIHIFKTKKEASLYVAAKIIHQIKHKNKSVLGLSTGKTMIPIYRDLIHSYKTNMVDFSNIKTFNVDEYANLDKENKNSFYNYMVKNLFSKTNFKKASVNFPTKNNYPKYDNLIKKSGNLDLIILGIGNNGHIAFNEPGSKQTSKTRKIKLSEETIKQNNLKRKKISEAYTIGISTILNAKKIILVAYGKNKSKIINEFINGNISSQVPASFLRKHKDVLVVLDKKASRLL